MTEKRVAHYYLDEDGILYADTASIFTLQHSGVAFEHFWMGDFIAKGVDIPNFGKVGEIFYARIDGTEKGNALVKAGFDGRPHQVTFNGVAVDAPSAEIVIAALKFRGAEEVTL